MQFAERDFMENFEKIIENQKKLLILIEKYETQSRKLLESDVDDIINLVNSRGSILKRIDHLTKEIFALCEEDSYEYHAFKNDCNRSDLPDYAKEIFDLRQQFNSHAVRAHDMDPEIIEKIKILRSHLLDDIKENNNSQTAKAAKYYGAGLTQGENFYFPKNNRKI